MSERIALEKQGKILIVDDEVGFRESIARRIELMGLFPLKASCGGEAVELVQKNHVDLAVVDLKMPDMDGLVIIAQLKKIRPAIRTILLTGYGNDKVREAALALHAGYFEKDNMGAFWSFLKEAEGLKNFVPDFSRLEWVRSTETAREKEEEIGKDAPAVEGTNRRGIPAPTSMQDVIRIPSDEYCQSDFHWLIGDTPAMEALKKDITTAAMIESPLLITGEDGTGRELVARSTHHLSRRRKKLFAAVDCNAFTRKALESEFWGEDREPDRIKRGLIENCEGGSLLLKDVERLSSKMQERLLRLMHDKTMFRARGRSGIRVNLRIMAATGVDLKELVGKKKFSKGLFEAISAFELHLPPLRERRDDIATLCCYFLDKYKKEYGKEVKNISDEVLSLFMNYPFTGNVRELANLIERAVIIAGSTTLKRRHLPERFQPEVRKERGATRLRSLADMESEYILEVLEAVGGNKSKAVEVLGISRGALWRKLKKLTESRVSEE